MQHLYRSDRAGAEDHLALDARLEHFAALHEAHADSAPLLNDETINQHVLFEPQIGTLQCWLQKTPRG